MSIVKKLQFINEIDKLKSVLRINNLHNAERRENTAEHSWHIALMAAVFLEEAENTIDPLKAIKMALIHDIVEIDAGDTYAFDEIGYEDKFERELKASRRLFSMLPSDLSDEYQALWLEYEEQSTAEACFILALDRLAPLLSHLGNKGKVWKEKSMTKELLMTRASAIRVHTPKIWPEIEARIEEAVTSGILKEK